jgi:4-aminobutyrate aminotransferase-like enzyme
LLLLLLLPGGNNAAVAAGRAVLQEICQQQLQPKAADTGRCVEMHSESKA